MPNKKPQRKKKDEDLLKKRLLKNLTNFVQNINLEPQENQQTAVRTERKSYLEYNCHYQRRKWSDSQRNKLRGQDCCLQKNNC